MNSTFDYILFPFDRNDRTGRLAAPDVPPTRRERPPLHSLVYLGDGALGGVVSKGERTWLIYFEVPLRL